MHIWGFLVTDYIKYYAYTYDSLHCKLSLNYFCYNNCDISLLAMFILTYSTNLPCGGKNGENPCTTFGRALAESCIYI